MPVFIHLANIIVEKATIKKKYQGGIKQFKIDYSFGEVKRHQEDDELFAIAFQNILDFEIGYLVEKGLDFDAVNTCSNDFAILLMHGNDSWKVDWLEHNAAFA